MGIRRDGYAHCQWNRHNTSRIGHCRHDNLAPGFKIECPEGHIERISPGIHCLRIATPQVAGESFTVGLLLPATVDHRVTIADFPVDEPQDSPSLSIIKVPPARPWPPANAGPAL